MALGSRILPEVQRVIANGSISGTYAKIGTPLANPCVYLYMLNNTDVVVTISLDGVNDHFTLPASTSPNAVYSLNVSANKAVNPGLYIGQGTQFWVKTAGSPSTGSLYITPWFIENLR